MWVTDYKNGGKWLSAEKATFLKCCGSLQVTTLTSNERIREDYMEEVAVELTLCRWHLGRQGRKGTFRGGMCSRGLEVGRCVPAQRAKNGVLWPERKGCQEM